MCQHFLLSAKARTLSIASVLRMTDGEVETMFAGIRWMETNGKAVCPHCQCPTCYEARRPNGALRFRCKACRKDFSLTSGTLFAFHKLPLRAYLAAIVVFCNEVKGKSALALSRDLSVPYKTAFVLAHKLREAMSTEVKGYKLGGVGKTVEVDGAYFGGYVKPNNLKIYSVHVRTRKLHTPGTPLISGSTRKPIFGFSRGRSIGRVDRRLARNQTGKRQCVVVIRERDGYVMPSAFATEGAAIAYIRNHVAAGTEIMADEATSWNGLDGHYAVKRINHQVAYSLDGACINGAESFFSRLRRAEQGHHHHIAGPYLARYAQESAWREGHRRDDNGAQVGGVVGLAMKAKPSVDFCGYWQRSSLSSQ